MIYFNDNKLLIRTILPTDPQIIYDEEIAQGWNQTIDKYMDRIHDFNNGKCISLIAEYQGAVAGYINVYPNSTWGSFADSGYGSAQRMYIKRGYIPDGKGVWYGNEVAAPHKEYCNDDDLNIYLSKKLR